MYILIYIFNKSRARSYQKQLERNTQREKVSRKERGWGREERKGAREQGRKTEYRNSL